MEFARVGHPGYPVPGPDDWDERIEADPRWLERSGDSFATGGSSLTHLGPLIGVIAISGVVLGLTWPMGAIWVGLAIAGLLFVLASAVRVELGLLMLVAVIPWEAQTRLSQSFTLPKAMGFLVAGLGLLHVFAKSGQRWPTTFKIVTLFCLWACLGVAVKPSLQALLLLLALLSNAILIYLCLRFCSGPAVLRSLILVIFLSSVGEALLGLLMYAVMGVHVGVQGRLTTSKDININNYVRLMFFGVFLGPIVFICFKSVLARTVAVLGIVASLAAALLTGSRGAMLGMFAGVALTVFTVRSAKLRTGAKLAMMAAALVLFLAAALIASRGGGGKLWAERISAKGLAGGFEARVHRWQESLDLGLGNPVFGVGFGNEGTALYFEGFKATESHNDLISALAMTGIPGLLLFVAFLGAWLWEVWRLPPGVWRSSLLGLGAAFTLAGMFNPSLSKKPFWLAVAICVTTIVCCNQARAAWNRSSEAEGQA
jgi:O-antigen ligase